MRDYLSKSERENYLAFMVALDLAEELLKSSAFEKKDLTNLKKALTFSKKFLGGSYENLNEAAKKTLDNSLKSCSFFVDDLYKAKLKEKKINCELEAADDSNEEFLDFVEIIFDKDCKDCKNGNYKSCPFFNKFEEKMIYSAVDQGFAQCGKCKFSFIGGLNNDRTRKEKTAKDKK